MVPLQAFEPKNHLAFGDLYREGQRCPPDLRADVPVADDYSDQRGSSDGRLAVNAKMMNLNLT